MFIITNTKTVNYDFNVFDYNTQIFVEKMFNENMIGYSTNHGIEQEIDQRLNVILGIIALLPEESKKNFKNSLSHKNINYMH